MPTWWGGRSRDGGREKERRESGLAPTVAVVAYAAHGPALGDAKGRVEGEEDTVGARGLGAVYRPGKGRSGGVKDPDPLLPGCAVRKGARPAALLRADGMFGEEKHVIGAVPHIFTMTLPGICYVLVQLPAQRRWRGRRKPAGHGCAGVISVAGFLGTLNKPQDRPRV